MNNNKYMVEFDEYMYDNAYQLESENDFLDTCLNKFGKALKYIGNKGLEFIKRKYMIGKYSRNLRKKLQVYNQMKPIYNDIVLLSKIIESENYDKNIYNTYIKFCNRLNSYCRKFSDIFPKLNYYNPEDAVYNYFEIKKYMCAFSGRKGIKIN